MNATRVATALREQGLPVELCFFYAADETPMPDWATLYLPHPPKGLGDAFKMLRAVLKDLRRWHPQSIIGFHPLANIVAGLSGFLCGCKVRVASHRSHPSTQRSLFRLIDKWLGALPFYTKIVCVSGDVAQSFSGHPKTFQRKISVIHNGLPERRSALSKADARAAFDLPQDAFLIGEVARLHPIKNQILLLDVLAGLPQDVRLVLAGDGPDRARLDEKTKALNLSDRVIFKDWVPTDRVPDFLAALDVFTFPSISEGFGLSLIEAAQQGLPIVASDIGIFRELLGDEASSGGILAPLDRPDMWQAALTHLRHDEALRARLSAGALQRATLFSLPTMTAQYQDILATDPAQETQAP